MQCHGCWSRAPVVAPTGSCSDCKETGVTFCDARARMCWLPRGNRGLCAVDGDG